LLLLTDARRAARTDTGGGLVSLEDQDRGLWDADRIAEGRGLVVAALRGPGTGPYAIQAAIAAVHAEAASTTTTDWPQIVALYDVLAHLSPSPVVQLNRAVAVAMRDGPQAGLAALDTLPDEVLRGYHLLPAARADLLRKLGRTTEAAAAYRAALELASNERERAFLRKKLTEL
jgi:RNA polymerase sigma-70 factor (ECF subfamily)